MTAFIWYLTSTIVMLLTGWYLGWRLINPAGLTIQWKWIAWISLMLLIGLPFISFYISRLGFEKVSYVSSWIGYISLGLISFVFTLLLVRDLVFLFWSGGAKSFFLVKDLFAGSKSDSNILLDPERRRFLINATNIGILAISSSLTGYGIFQARRKPAINKFNISIPNLPQDLQGLKIVQISDIHAGLTIRRNWIETVVAEVNKLNPDIVAITGDLVDGSVAKLAEDVAPMAGLKSSLGNFFVTGNHEYYSGALSWIEKIKDLGFTVLLNEGKAITKGDSRLLISGVTDYSAGQFIPEHLTNPQAALNINAKVDVRIFMAHQPRSLYKAAQYGFDLMLSGHTHGGQFFPWNLFATIGQPFIKGLNKYETGFGEGWVYVSKGTGYWGPPVRVNARSEIGVFVLQKA